MKMLLYYIRRWNTTKSEYLWKNIISCSCIVTLTCYATAAGAFEQYAATRTFLFSVLMCSVWSGTFNSIGLFYSELGYIMDDLSKFLSVKIYISANFLIQVFLCGIQSIFCTVIFKLFCGYDTSGLVFQNRNFEFCFTFFLIILSADMLGLVFGMIINSMDLAMAIIPGILIVNLLLSGCLFELSGVLERVSIYTTAKWGFSALGSISDLNAFLPIEMQSGLFEYSSAFIENCWLHLLEGSGLCLMGAGILLYFRINQDMMK